MSVEIPPDVDYFKLEVREYDDIDNEIKTLNEQIKPIQQKIKELKAKKSQLQGNLCEFMSRNKIDACNVSGLDKIPSKKIGLQQPVGGSSNPISLSQLPAGSLSQRPLVSVNEADTVSIATAASSIKLSYKTSKTTKPATKEFIRSQCLKFFTDAWRSDEFRKLSESEKGVYLYEYLYNPEDRETVEKPMLKKTLIN